VDLHTLNDAVIRGLGAFAAAPRLLGVPIIFILPTVLMIALVT
jgi:hypothetical protein